MSGNIVIPREKEHSLSIISLCWVLQYYWVKAAKTEKNFFFENNLSFYKPDCLFWFAQSILKIFGSITKNTGVTGSTYFFKMREGQGQETKPAKGWARCRRRRPWSEYDKCMECCYIVAFGAKNRIECKEAITYKSSTLTRGLFSLQLSGAQTAVWG